MANGEPGRPHLEVKISRAFSPGTPINIMDLFSGRNEQLRRVIDAVNQRGQHAIVFGERGVGKTSLANILPIVLSNPKQKILTVKINCDGSDDFSSLWKKVFSEINIVVRKKKAGFFADEDESISPLSDDMPRKLTPDLVFKTVRRICENGHLITVIDEFDRMQNPTAGRMIADTIKMLSDYSVDSTLIIVGVADVIDDLIKEHLSIERALAQIQMPRMTRKELSEILNKGFNHIGVKADEGAIGYISSLSQGLPHYTHLLGLHAVRDAIDHASRTVSVGNVESATEKAISTSQQSIMKAYHIATTSPRKDNIFSEVLLACALSRGDDLGYFAASGIRNPLSRIMGRYYEIPAFARHLKEFCDPKRGPVLQKTGFKHRYRYRFVNPLMQPFTIMQGLASRKITKSVIDELDKEERKK